MRAIISLHYDMRMNISAQEIWYPLYAVIFFVHVICALNSTGFSYLYIFKVKITLFFLIFRDSSVVHLMIICLINVTHLIPNHSYNNNHQFCHDNSFNHNISQILLLTNSGSKKFVKFATMLFSTS